MKTYSLLLLFFINIGYSQSDNFYKKVLSNFNNKNYYVSVNAVTTTFKGKIVIKSDDLLYFLNKTKKYNQSKYMKVLKSHLKSDIPLKIEDEIFSEYSFIKLTPNQSIDDDFNKGKAFFLDKYFNRNVEKGMNSPDVRLAIIDKLFLLKIPSYRDDETGALVIVKWEKS